MTRHLPVAAIQFNVKLGDVDANLDQVLRGLDRTRDHAPRLAVLPEMWSTGYDYKNLPRLAEETPRVLAALAETAAEREMVLVGSLPEKADGKIYNTAYVIDRGEQVSSYRKLHLFSTMGEDRFLAAGDQAGVVPTSVGRLGVAICYDLRFPELFRKLALEGAEILCIPAEWPAARREHWRTLLRARAIENQVFVAAANCCDLQGKIDFAGTSMLISAWGEVLAEGRKEDTVLTATFDFEEMLAYRKQIRCFHDRRPEIYGTLP